MTGRLDIMTAAKDADGQPISLACTGTAITPRYILTNSHCLKSSGRHRAISVLFLPNFRDARRRNGVTAYPVSLTPVERGSEDALDYAILRLETPLENHQPLGLAIRDPGQGEPLVVIGHPEGQPLHLSRGRCRSDSEVPIDGDDVVHGCATLAGSSGSLVYSSEGQIVGLHFWGGSLLGGRQVNRAIRMVALVEQSLILRDILRVSVRSPKEPNCEQVLVPPGFECLERGEKAAIVPMSELETEGNFFIQIEAILNLADFEESIRKYEALGNLAVNNNGPWHLLAHGPFSEDEAMARLIELRSLGLIPRDSFIAESSGPIGIYEMLSEKSEN